MEYDIYDRIDTIFLSTLSREKLLHKYRDNIVSVHVIQKTTKLYLNDLLNILVLSEYSIGKNSSWLNDLSHYCDQKNIPYEYALQKTLCDNLFEGFYIKIETDNYVSGRYKWIRKNFMNIILQNLHWKKYPIIYNQISPLT